MKMFKKVFSAICSLAIVASMVTAVQAAELGYNPMSLAITDNGDNTVTVDVKTTETALGNIAAYVKIPEALQAYVADWTASTNVPANVLDSNGFTYSTKADGYKVGSSTKKALYIQAGMTGNGGVAFAVPSDGVVLSVTLTLVEGGIPSTVPEADRTITLGGDYVKNTQKVGTTMVGISGSTYLLYRADDAAAGKVPGTYFSYDPTATGNYVVVPTAKANDPVTATVVGDTRVGDKETEGDEADTTDKAVAIFGTPVAPESVATSLVWTVTDKSDVTKTFTQAVNVEGGAEYTFGLVLRNITADLIKTVSAAFAQ